MGTITPTNTSTPKDEPTSSQTKDASQASDDVEMGEGDEDEIPEEDDGSDNESMTSDSQRPSKKKKGQRFFCTDYPPCQLSFTRSEHLARHIRSVMEPDSRTYQLTNSITGNILASVRSNVIALVVSRGSTICVSTRKPSMSTKISLVTRLQRRALGFRDRFGPIAYGHRAADRAHRLSEVRAGTREGIVATSLLQA
jgi:hypothetical protein